MGAERMGDGSNYIQDSRERDPSMSVYIPKFVC